MTPSTAEPTLRYDSRTIFLHWLTAALVATLWVLGQTIDWFPKGDPRVVARSTHMALGVVLLVVLLTRIRWRLSGGSVHLRPAQPGRFDRLAALAHRALYALLATTVLLGLTNAWVRGDSVFGLFAIRAFDPADKEFRSMIEDWHELSANVLLAVALFHAAAGLVHHYLLKDSVLRRMLPLSR